MPGEDSKTPSNRLFDVEGPFDIPFDQKRAAKIIKRGCPEFWRSHSKLAKKRGCYVMGIRASQGYAPIYVGKTHRNFKSECFTSHKLNKYHDGLADFIKCTPIMFFLIPESDRGKPNRKVVRDLELHLIELGVTRNPDLTNVQGRKEKQWGIKGILRGPKGKPSKSVSEFKKFMGYQKSM